MNESEKRVILETLDTDLDIRIRLLPNDPNDPIPYERRVWEMFSKTEDPMGGLANVLFSTPTWARHVNAALKKRGLGETWVALCDPTTVWICPYFLRDSMVGNGASTICIFERIEAGLKKNFVDPDTKQIWDVESYLAGKTHGVDIYNPEKTRVIGTAYPTVEEAYEYAGTVNRKLDIYPDKKNICVKHNQRRRYL